MGAFWLAGVGDAGLEELDGEDEAAPHDTDRRLAKRRAQTVEPT
jgi:hypothetical protein